MFLTWAPIVISFIALFIAYKSNENSKESAKENFRINLIDKLKNAKYIILKLEFKEYEHREKMLLIESVNDHLLYQQNNKEKNKYMSENEQDKLSVLQESIEDCLAVFLSGTDEDINRNLAISGIKEYLKIL